MAETSLERRWLWLWSSLTLVAHAAAASYECGDAAGGASVSNCSACMKWANSEAPYRACDSEDCAYWKGTCRPRQEPWGGPMDFPYPPDVRPRECRQLAAQSKDEDFSDLKVSVVIPWLNETWEHLEGTLRSLVHFTPDELIVEYLFVSDGNINTREKELKAISPKVKVMALKERNGLIRAKMWGVEEAKGPVIMFLEGHCIVNKNWLQPLLQRVKANPRVLAMPQLDIIPAKEWYRYKKGEPGYWRYEWNFNVIYSNPGHVKEMDYLPFPSPGTSGGIFAMRKDWFQDLDLFDPGLEEWGGDHFEITMKVWRCGGRIEAIPCSRIGHLFRDPVHRPYDVSMNNVVRNYARLARVWVEDHLETFYSMKGECRDMRFPDEPQIRERYESLVKRLQCKNMQWYLDNVDFEMAWEQNRLCIPNIDKSLPYACPGPGLPARATVDNTIPLDEFLVLKSKATPDGAVDDWKPL